jgi:MurNAc alpha-1-phosphate uridylyltransferase
MVFRILKNSSVGFINRLKYSATYLIFAEHRKKELIAQFLYMQGNNQVATFCERTSLQLGHVNATLKVKVVSDNREVTMRVVNKAVILAAGFGTRLRKYTEHIPKPLIKVNDKCQIDYAIQWLAQAGIREFHINLHRYGEQIETHLKQEAYKEYNFTFYNGQPNILGTGGGICPMFANLGIDPFIVANADSIILEHIQNLLSAYERQNLPDAMLMVSTDPNMINSYSGEIRLEQNRVVRIREQGVHSSGTAQPAVFCGVSILRSKVWQTSDPEVKPSCLIGDVLIPWLLAQNPIYAYITSEPFFDVGTPERLNYATDLLKRKHLL